MEFASAVPLINGVESFVERSPPAIAGALGAVVSIVIVRTDEGKETWPPTVVVRTAVISPEAIGAEGVNV